MAVLIAGLPGVAVDRWADDIAVPGWKYGLCVIITGVDIEMVVPEIRQYFQQLPFTVCRAGDNVQFHFFDRLIAVESFNATVGVVVIPQLLQGFIKRDITPWCH